MIAAVKFAYIALSATVLSCLLYSSVMPSFKWDASNDGVRKTAVGGKETTCAKSKCDVVTSTRNRSAMGSTSSTNGTPSGSKGTNRRRVKPSSSPVTATTPHVTTQWHKPIPPPSNILYLIQTEQCIPPYFKLNDVFGSPNLGYEIIVLSFKEACLDTSMPHVQYLLDNSTTWTTGRNVLFEAAMSRNQTYLYYVFMDDDFALGDPRQLPIGPWRRFENSLRSYEPAIAAIDNTLISPIRNFHVERQCSGEAAEFIGTVWFDAICNAFHYKAIRHILPYDPTFDQQTWWASQMSVIIRSEVLFRGQVVIHSELFGRNEQHRPYPRDFNFSPEMIDHMTKDFDTFFPTFRARCANVTVQQWRTMNHLEHGLTSPTLCLPPAPYHDTISPGRYACA